MKTYDLVKKILEEKVACRSSDKHLIWVYMTHKAGKDGAPMISMPDFLNCSPFESITRARRKVQELHPELKSSTVVNDYRKKKQNTKGTFIYREDNQGRFL